MPHFRRHGIRRHRTGLVVEIEHHWMRAELNAQSGRRVSRARRHTQSIGAAGDRIAQRGRHESLVRRISRLVHELSERLTFLRTS